MSCSPHFGQPWKSGNPRIPRSLGNGVWEKQLFAEPCTKIGPIVKSAILVLLSGSSHFGGLRKPGASKKFLNKPCEYGNSRNAFACPRCTGAHMASQNRNLTSLAENGRFLNKPLIWKCYFPVPFAVPCRAIWTCSIFLYPLLWFPENRNLGALPKMVDFLISR